MTGYRYELKTKVSAWEYSSTYLTRDAAETSRRECIRLGLEVGPVEEKASKS